METYLTHNERNLAQLLEVLPPIVAQYIETNDLLPNVVEVVLDYGREAIIRLTDGTSLYVDGYTVSHEDILCIYTDEQLQFAPRKNRATIKDTLHRVSFLYNYEYKPIGVTLRIGKLYNTGISLLQPLLAKDSSILLIGRPGVGKSSRLREIARHLSTNQRKNVMIVDSNNEIAGGGDVPHYAVGNARRLMVPDGREIFEAMLEAVENHMPEYVVIDEVSDRKEAKAVQSVAERGIKVIATVHGNTIEDVVKNHEINCMLGKIKSVTLSDSTAKKTNNGNKIKIEREFKCAFDSAAELRGFDLANIYFDLESAVDGILGGAPVPGIERRA